ncbi:FYVE and coiled-coil domain-containing protein 1-like isoform X2 [Clavelina lepadiformis]|uniref:FYVE and coiled-coil domain-containing protein 1 n=1 Tax=Clavelina lepadiformis TaxID=159417 RepID=A0ABP0FZI1_CLALP
MATRSNLPKIVTDIQDVVTQICKDFESSNREPITDDSHALHRLCAKLEFLLTSSLKEKSILGTRRNYWHWIYSCLKTTKGLNDGIRYVHGNKEIKSSKGRGRAFIRYCLVHQTLADSLQNCIMNDSMTSQHISPNSVLTNQTYSSAFVTSLYDLNAVNFDLNSKGFDLDSGWPTFASKRNPSVVDQWAVRSHTGSFGSLASASVVMETPRLHGSGSSGAPSVDQRVEELVLELDQSDCRIKEQQDLILELQGKIEAIVKASNEKEDILARVISDLESKNRHLQEALSHMSSEFQEREHNWSEKHEKLSKEMDSSGSTNASLVSKVEQLEADKRTLEELVSQHMSKITSNFSQNSSNVINSPLTPTTSTPVYSSSHERFQLEENNYKNENKILNTQLQDCQKQCLQLKMKLNGNVSNAARLAEVCLQLEEEQQKLAKLEASIVTSASAQKLFLERLKKALDITDEAVGNQFEMILQHVTKSKENVVITETAQKNPTLADNDHESFLKSLKEENEILLVDFEATKHELGQYKQKLRESEVRMESMKLELASADNKSSNHLVDLEEQLSISNERCQEQVRHNAEILADLKATQERLKHTEVELQKAKQLCNELELKERELIAENLRMQQRHEDEICENELVFEELQAEIQQQENLNEALDKDLEKEKQKAIKLNGDLSMTNKAIEVFNDNIREQESMVSQTEKTLLEFQTGMNIVTNRLLSYEKQLEILLQQVEGFFHNIRLIDESEDVGDFKLDDDAEEMMDPSIKEQWRKMQERFVNILNKYKNLKRDLALTETQHEHLQQNSDTYKDSTETEIKNLKERLSEMQSNFDIHLITIKDLSDKHKVLQDAKAENSDHIDRLEYENNELKQVVVASKSVADELRLRLMEGSAQKVELEDKIKSQDSDILSLKEKITELLLDKDALWKSGEELQDKLRKAEQADDLDESGWVHDNEVTSCSSCGNTFTLTLRKHHCRICGNIFCKNCCCSFVIKGNKKLRSCIECFQKRQNINVPDPNASVKSVDASDVSTLWETPNSSTRDFEEITPEECASVVGVDGKDDGNLSIYDTSSARSVKSEDTVNIPARKSMYLPILVEQPGVILQWEISSDRSIDFKVCYSPTEEDEPQDLMAARRIESHLEPFIGQLEAKQEGVYSIVLDNTFSRINPKKVTYQLHTVINS